jgi:DNA-binding MarR family transcriptional regulator
MTRPIPSTRREVTWHNPALLILASLVSGPKCGRTVIRDVHATTGVLIDPAVVSMTIRRLGDLGLVESVACNDRRIRVHRLTPRGKTTLRDLVVGMADFVAEHLRRTRRAG